MQVSLGMRPIWAWQWNWLGPTKSSSPGNHLEAFAVPNRSLQRKWFLGFVFRWGVFLTMARVQGINFQFFCDSTHAQRCQLRFSRRTATSCSHWRLSMAVSFWSGCVMRWFSSAKSMGATILTLEFTTSQQLRTYCAIIYIRCFVFLYQVPVL